MPFVAAAQLRCMGGLWAWDNPELASKLPLKGGKAESGGGWGEREGAAGGAGEGGEGSQAKDASSAASGDACG